MRKDELALQIDCCWDWGRRCFNDLTDAEKHILTALIIQKSKTPWDYVTEGNLPRYVADYLLNPSADNKIELIHEAANSAVSAAEVEINRLFERRAELETYLNPSRKPSDLELSVMAHNRAVAAEINSQRSQLC